MLAELRQALFRLKPVRPTMAIPPPDQYPVEVYVDLYGLNIFSIDEREETFEIEAFIYADWFDSRLAFDPAVVAQRRRYFRGERPLRCSKPTFGGPIWNW